MMSICVYGKGKGMYHFIWEQERSTAFFAMIFNMLKIFLNTYLEKLRREKDLNTHDSVFWIVTPLRTLIKDKKYYFCYLELCFLTVGRRKLWLRGCFTLKICSQRGHFFPFAMSSVDTYISLLKGMWYDFSYR